MRSLKIWSDGHETNEKGIGKGFCLHCEHAFGEHYESCKFNRRNIDRTLFATEPRAFVMFYNGIDTTGERLDLKYVVAYGGNLTDKKRLEFGRIGFVKFMERLGRPDGEKTWDEAPEVECLRWTKTRGGRYDKVTIEVDRTYENITFSHDRGSFSTYLDCGWFEGFKEANR